MKMETKTGRWKYVAIVLIVTLLVGLFWNYVKNGPKGEIYLYGETHSKQSILDKELSIWGEYYEKGMRDLFVEFPYTDAQFLNLWMQADDDELLDLQFKDWGGTEGGTEVMKNFLKQIKEQYPETVFHGTDVGHTWESTGPRYLAYLEANGQKDTEEYKRTQENMEQGNGTMRSRRRMKRLRFDTGRIGWWRTSGAVIRNWKRYAAPISWVSMEVHILWSRSIGTRTFAWQNS